MTRNLRPFALAAFLGLVATSPSAFGQYPPGYGGYGWHGWGGGAGSGRTAAGLGAMSYGAGNAAAGFGQRNVDNAQARSMNAQTAMGVNNYMWECNQRNIQMYQARIAGEQADNVKAISDIQDRMLNHPSEIDISKGDALNAVMGEITNPQIYQRTLELAQRPLKSAMVKKLPFEFAAGGITYSLQELTDRDNVPDVFKRSEFDDQRKTVRALAQQLQKEATAQRSPTTKTLKQFRAALDGVKTTLDNLNIDPGAALEAHKYLKALMGLSKMMDSPSYDVYLASVDQVPEVPLCEVLIFMHSFNLQFGPANDPATREYYSQLYAALSEVRQQVNPPAGAAQAAGANGPARDNRVTNFYGNVPYSHLQPPPPGNQ